MKENPDVSIIIPAYNEENLIASCLDSLLNQDYQKDRYEIIVVNDGSTDQTKNIIERYTFKYSNLILINKDNRGKASAQNFGLKYAKGKYILITDSDAIVEKKWISKMVNDLVKYDIVIGSYYSKENHKLLEKIQNSHYLIKFKYGGLKGRPCIGVNNGFRKSVIVSIGNFDESKTSVTDDFIKRAEDIGLKIYFNPNIVVLTKCTTNIHGFLKQKLRWNEGPLLSIKNGNMNFIDFLGLIYIGGLSLILFISLLLSLVSLDPRYFLLSDVITFTIIFFFYLKPFVKLCKSQDNSYAVFFVGYIFIEIVVRTLLIPYYVCLLIQPRKKPTFESNRI